MRETKQYPTSCSAKLVMHFRKVAASNSSDLDNLELAYNFKVYELRNDRVTPFELRPSSYALFELCPTTVTS